MTVVYGHTCALLCKQAPDGSVIRRRLTASRNADMIPT